MEEQTIWIVYGSPGGTTRQVAETIANEVQQEGGRIFVIDLFQSGDGIERMNTEIRAGDLLFVGSPTYSNHPLPTIMTFISGLPMTVNVGAAFFTTYGMVSSGLALYDMALLSMEKGLTVLSGIKVPAVHSMLWHEKNPLGEGRPNADDLAKVSLFARSVLKKSREVPQTLPPEKFLYHSQEVLDKASKASLNAIKGILLPLDVNEAACTACGLCVDNCPTSNITLEQAPVFGEECILCFNCVRFCGDSAITSKVLPFIGGEIQKYQTFFNEAPEVKWII
jgi:ferredoxin/flavodoxin